MWRIMEVEEGVTCWGCKVEVDNTLLWYEDCTHSMLVITLQYYISKVGVGGGGGVICLGHKAEADNSLWDLHNPSDDAKAELNIIALSFIQNNS